jgi:hypothetical protein
LPTGTVGAIERTAAVLEFEFDFDVGNVKRLPAASGMAFMQQQVKQRHMQIPYFLWHSLWIAADFDKRHIETSIV